MKSDSPSQAASSGEKYDIRPGQSLELLKALHILTRDGKLNQDSRRKLKQVYHLFNFIEPLLQKIHELRGEVTLVDHGAGKSYLGFMLYDLFFKPQARLNGKLPGTIHGVEVRDELVRRSADLAQRFGFDGMRFLNQTVAASGADTELPGRIDIVTALHACDTATDDAIAFGLKRAVEHLVLIPCCQAEVAAALNFGRSKSPPRTVLAELWRHPMHAREFGSQLTNVLRCLQLEAHGYKVSVTELVGWEHSMKNELIIATRRSPEAGKSVSARSTQRLNEMLDELGLERLRERFFSPSSPQ